MNTSDAPHPIAEPAVANAWQLAHVELILGSYARLTGRALLGPLPDEPAAARAQRLYSAPFVLLSHDTQGDPCFNYANLTAQRLFEHPWAGLVGLPSRYSAEPVAREARQKLLETVANRGYTDDYSGIRIASSGRRFLIRAACVWNLLDADGRLHGQAATFAHWEAAPA